MVSLVVFSLVSAMVVCAVLAVPAELPEVSDEALELALSDKRYLVRQLKCALGEGGCDPIGRRLKTYAPLVLRGNCTRCTEKEIKQIQKVLSHIQRNYPKEWNQIIKQYAS